MAIFFLSSFPSRSNAISVSFLLLGSGSYSVDDSVSKVARALGRFDLLCPSSSLMNRSSRSDPSSAAGGRSWVLSTSSSLSSVLMTGASSTSIAVSCVPPVSFEEFDCIPALLGSRKCFCFVRSEWRVLVSVRKIETSKSSVND